MFKEIFKKNNNISEGNIIIFNLLLLNIALNICVMVLSFKNQLNTLIIMLIAINLIAMFIFNKLEGKKANVDLNKLVNSTKDIITEIKK